VSLRPLIADAWTRTESRLRHIFYFAYFAEAGVGVRARLDAVMSMPLEV